MTTETTGYQDTSIQTDRQDHIRRGLFDGFEDVPSAGRVMDIRGTGWQDQEVVLLNVGYSFNPAPEMDCEVLSFDAGANTDNRHALMTIPRNRQYPWPVGTGGIQDAADPSRRVEFSRDGLHLTNGTAFIGPNRELKITVDGAGNIEIAGAGPINFVSSSLRHNGVNIGSTHTHTDPPGTAGGQTSGPN